MFSRVASTVARAPARVAAVRRLSSRAASSVCARQQGPVAFGAAAAAAAGALAVAGLALTSEKQEALCAAPTFKYTGEPGTAHERSFIVSAAAW